MILVDWITLNSSASLRVTLVLKIKEMKSVTVVEVLLVVLVVVVVVTVLVIVLVVVRETEYPISSNNCLRYLFMKF